MIKDRAVMEAHLALLGWVPYNWARAAARRHDLCVWLNYEADSNGDWFGWTRPNMFPDATFDPGTQWPEDDGAFWQLAKALTEDERFK